MNNIDLIKQYAETGAKLPEYQVTKLSRNILKTYLRRRILQSAESNAWYAIESFEFDLMEDDMKLKVANQNANNQTLRIREYAWAPYEWKREYMKSNILNAKFFHFTPEPLKREYIDSMLSEDMRLDDFLVSEVPEDKLKEYIIKRIKDRKTETQRFFKALNDELKFYYISLAIKLGSPFEPEIIPAGYAIEEGPEFVNKFIEILLDNDIVLRSGIFKYATEEQQKRSIDLVAVQGVLINYYHLVNTYASPSVREYYKKLEAEERINKYGY